MAERLFLTDEDGVEVVVLADEVLDLLAEKAGDEDNPVDRHFLQRVEDVTKERLAGDADERSRGGRAGDP